MAQYFVMMERNRANALVTRLGDCATYCGYGFVQISERGLDRLRFIPIGKRFTLTVELGWHVIWDGGKPHIIQQDQELSDDQVAMLCQNLGLRELEVTVAPDGTWGQGDQSVPWWWVSTILAWAAQCGARDARRVTRSIAEGY